MNGSNPPGDSPGVGKDTFIIIDSRQARQGEPVIDKREETSLSGGDFRETVTIRLKRADCGHFLHTSAEAGGITVTGRILCAECAKKSVCHRCGRLVIGENQRRIMEDEEEKMVCRWCKRKRLFSVDWPELAWWLCTGIVLLLLFRAC